MPVEPLPPYPGPVDKEGNPVDWDDYNDWYDALPHEWRLNPALCLFVRVDSATTVSDLETYLANTFTPEMMATIDDVIVLEDSAHYISPLLKDKNIITTSQSIGDKDTIITDTNVKFTDFTVSGNESGISNLIQPQSIDVGSGAINRPTSLTSAYTLLDYNNPANATGTIDTIEIWPASNLALTEIGTLYGTAPNFADRDYEYIGSVTSGSKQTFSPVDIDIETGDYLGIYYASGNIESNSSGYNGVYYDLGSQFGTGQTEYMLLAGDAISIYGTGTESGGDPEISVLPVEYDFGVVAESTEPYTATDYFTITNSSTMQTDQTISVTSATWTGGNAFTHSDTATPGADTVGLLANQDGTWGVGDVIVKYASPNYIVENQPANTSYNFGIKLLSPTSASDGVEKENTVRITATAD